MSLENHTIVDAQPNLPAPAVNLSRMKHVADAWIEAPYYEQSEEWLYMFWDKNHKEKGEIFSRFFDTLDKRHLVELACGHGRHTNHILNDPVYGLEVEDVRLLDINEENIRFCKERFANCPKVSLFHNNGYDLRPLEDESATAIFSYDAMVHFEYDTVFSYIREAHRVLVPGGRALFHHSNLDKFPGTTYMQNPSWRNFMSKNLFAHVARLTGFYVRGQKTLEWGSSAHAKDIDCVTLLEKLLPPATT